MRLAPEKLAELIELHNAIYWSPKARDVNKLKELEQARPANAVWWYRADKEALKVCLKGAPKLVKDYVYRKSNEVYFEPSTNDKYITSIERAAARYEDLRESLVKLSDFVAYNTDTPGKADKQITRIIQGTIRIARDEQGLVTLIKDTFIRAIEGAEYDRIRKCLRKNCNKVFYAGRLIIKCCSAACSNAYRNQKLRERYKADRTGYVLKQTQRERKKKKGVSEKKRKGE